MVKKLKLRVPRAEDAPAELREFYAPLPNGTGFILQYEEDPDGYGIDQIGPLRAKVAALTEDVARQINRVQQFKKADGSLYTPEELTTLASGFTELQGQLATLKDKTKTDEQKLQQLVADAKRPLLEKQQQLEARNKRMTERAQKAAMQQARDRALDELKPLPKFRGVIGAEIMRHLQSVENEETGEFAVYVVDPETGQKKHSQLPGQNGAMDPTEFVKGSFRTQFADCLAADGKKGVGGGPENTPGNNDGQPPPGRVDGRDVHLSSDQARDFSAYKAAQEAAKKRGGTVIIDTLPSGSADGQGGGGNVDGGGGPG